MHTHDLAAGVDVHCHIDLFDSPLEVIGRAERAGIRTIAVTNAPSVFDYTVRLTTGCKYVFAALGLHPELVATHAHEITLFESLLWRTRYVGEVGLDYFKENVTTKPQQREVFDRIVTLCAESGDKVLTIHSRRAVADVLSILGQSFRGVAVLHWFSGTRQQLGKAASAGCWFSVNPAMTTSDCGKKLIAEMPPERVLTESDGPFVNIGERSAEPADAGQVITHLAQIWAVSTEAAKLQVWKNFQIAIGNMLEPT